MSNTVMKGRGAYELYDGDTILVGVTHEITVGRDKSWVKYEATSKVRPDEAAEDARDRVIGHVKQGVGTAVDATVEQIRSHR